MLPMSRQAIIDTIKTEMRMQAESSSCIVAVPGNYGLDFIAKEYKIEKERSIAFSNYIGETIDYARELEIRSLLLIGHIGKFVKLAGGIMNTHSNEADARAEIMAAHLLRVKPEEMDAKRLYKTAMAILCSNTSGEAVRILKEEGLLRTVMHSLAEAMYHAAEARSQRASALKQKLRKNKETEAKEAVLRIGVITYTPEEGELARAGCVQEILTELADEKRKNEEKNGKAVRCGSGAGRSRSAYDKGLSDDCRGRDHRIYRHRDGIRHRESGLPEDPGEDLTAISISDDEGRGSAGDLVSDGGTAD